MKVSKILKLVGTGLRIYALNLAVLFLVIMATLPGKAMAGSTNSYTLSVGDTKTLSFDADGKAIHSAGWYSNSSAIEVVSSGVTSCYIKVNSYVSSTVIVRCDYYYMLNNSLKADYADFYITIKESDEDSDSDSYSISVTPSTVNLDLANRTNTDVSVKLTGAVPDSWEIKTDNVSDSCVSVGISSKQQNAVNLNLLANKTGSGKLTLKLYDYVSSSKSVIRAKATLSYKVTCSHSYDSGEITKEPSADSTGTITYTCSLCGNTKTESIPELEETKPEETEQQETIQAEETEEEEVEEEEGEEEEEEEEEEEQGKDSDEYEEYDEDEKRRWIREKSYDLSECTIQIRKKSIKYTGKEIKPYLSVRLDGRLINARNYNIAYIDNIEAGTATAVIEGVGDYYGSQTKSFIIEKGTQDIRVLKRITRRSKDRDWDLDMNVRRKSGVTLSYICDDSRLAVDGNGVIHIPAGYTGTANITISAPETANWKAAKETVTVKIR